MPRRKNHVKSKHQKRELKSITSLGLVDIHFHGAYGIDLMRATRKDLDTLAIKLARQGVAGFCPTTLSAPPRELKKVVSRIGEWIVQSRKNQLFKGARPLGIHLEGPFISPHACGAHPPRAIRKLSPRELIELWEASRGTLKIITLAPEAMTEKQLSWLVPWARKKKIVLSLGHSKALRKESNSLFLRGFSGVTHAWNAMLFHHRDPGILGAALGRKNIYLELIVDQAHVSPEVIHWTLELHRPNPICMVSDCVTSGGTPSGRWHRFGTLRIRNHEGAARLANGGLAGGGKILTQSYLEWVRTEAKRRQLPQQKIFSETLRHVTTDPLRVLGLSPRKLGLTPLS